jgi:hypothetical protein
MRIAVSYNHGLADHIERELAALGQTVMFAGPPTDWGPGYDDRAPLSRTLAMLPQQPDLYLFIGPNRRNFPPGIEDLPMPTVGYLGDVHLGKWWEQVARFFDVVFIPHKDYLDNFRRVVGHNQVYWLPLSVPPDVKPQPGLPKIYDVGFVGNVVRTHRRTGRQRRLRLIAGRFRTNEFARTYTHQELSQVYSQSRIVFNNTINGDVNLRIFEGAACGALVLTDSDANGLGELFEIGREIVVYGDDADLLDKIAYYLAHEEEREQIARAGQQRTLAEHISACRTRTLLDILDKSPPELVAPMRRAGLGERLAARREVYTHLHALDFILDEARAAGYNPLQRAFAALPCLIRRLLL